MPQKIKVRFRRFREGAKIPTASTQHAVGYDLYACIENEEFVVVPPHQVSIIPTGINVRLPEDYFMSVVPRSGLAAKNAITIMNAPGTIDPDYDGDGEKYEIKIILYNGGNDVYKVHHGDKVGQALLVPRIVAEWEEEFEDNNQRLESIREGGLGHTGK